MNTGTPRTQKFNAWAESIGWPALCDSTMAFEAQPLRRLLKVWQDQAGDGTLPPRDALTARMLKPYLGNIIIIECSGGGTSARYRFRLVGTRLSEVLGVLQGRYFDEVLAPAVIDHWRSRFDLTVAESRPLRFVSRVDTQQKTFLQSESLWLPLAGEGDTTSVLLSAVLSFRGANRMPQWEAGSKAV